MSNRTFSTSNKKDPFSKWTPSKQDIYVTFTFDTQTLIAYHNTPELSVFESFDVRQAFPHINFSRCLIDEIECVGVRSPSEINPFPLFLDTYLVNEQENLITYTKIKHQVRNTPCGGFPLFLSQRVMIVKQVLTKEHEAQLETFGNFTHEALLNHATIGLQGDVVTLPPYFGSILQKRLSKTNAVETMGTSVVNHIDQGTFVTLSQDFKKENQHVEDLFNNFSGIRCALRMCSSYHGIGIPPGNEILGSIYVTLRFRLRSEAVSIQNTI